MRTAGLKAGLGPTVRPDRGAVSFARARAALKLAGPRDHLVSARERAGEIMLAADPVLAAEFATAQLAPLDAVSAGARERLVQTLRAWLDEQAGWRRRRSGSACTRRRCATGSGACATCSATRLTIPTGVSGCSWRCAARQPRMQARRPRTPARRQRTRTRAAARVDAATKPGWAAAAGGQRGRPDRHALLRGDHAAAADAHTPAAHVQGGRGRDDRRLRRRDAGGLAARRRAGGPTWPALHGDHGLHAAGVLDDRLRPAAHGAGTGPGAVRRGRRRRLLVGRRAGLDRRRHPRPSAAAR